MRLKNKTKKKMHLSDHIERVLIGSISVVLALWWEYTGKISSCKRITIGK